MAKRKLLKGPTVRKDDLRMALETMPRKPPKRAVVERIGESGFKVRTSEPVRLVEIERLPPILRLPPRTWACPHNWWEVCQYCVEDQQMRVQYGAALASKPMPRVLRVDFWRCSPDARQRKAAGMEDLKSSMAMLQHEMQMHEKYDCDGCRHCKEEELL